MKEISIKKAIKRFPEVMRNLLKEYPDIENDDNYIVRYDYESGIIEVGYKEDNWYLQDIEHDISKS